MINPQFEAQKLFVATYFKLNDTIFLPSNNCYFFQVWYDFLLLYLKLLYSVSFRQPLSIIMLQYRVNFLFQISN